MDFPTLLGGGSPTSSPKLSRKTREETPPESGAPVHLDFDALLFKLDASETKIRGLVGAAAPTVNLGFPRLSVSSFRPRAVKRSASGGFLEVATDMEAGAAGGVPTAAPRERLLQAVEETQEHLAEAASECTNLFEELKAPIMAGVLSLIVVTATALVGINPLLASTFTTAASTASFGRVLYARTNAVRRVVTDQLEATTQQVLEKIGSAKELVLSIPKQVLGVVGEMAEEQKPALEKIRELESTLQVDIPDPGDLKKPLVGCEEKVTAFLSSAEEEIPKQVQKLVASFHLGRLVLDTQLFNGAVGAVLLVSTLVPNIGLLLTQVAGLASEQMPQSHRSAERAVSFGTSWQSYLCPWFSQMAILVLQVVLTKLLLQGSRLCAAANCMIEKLEEKANSSINERLATAVAQIFGHAFEQVTEQCNVFFPKFHDVLGKLQEAMDFAEKAEEAARRAEEAARRAKELTGDVDEFAGKVAGLAAMW